MTKIKIDFDAPIPPTQRQLDFIQEIEEVIGEYFEGTTKHEACEWIDNHILIAREKWAEDRNFENWRDYG